MNDLKSPTAEAPAVPEASPTASASGKTRGDRYIRVAAIVVVVVLAAVAMYVSYRHQFELAIGYGEPEETARLFPITIDGVIIMASLIMLYCARLRLPVPPLARLALWSGIIATLVANAAHGWDAGVGGRLVSAAPAAVLVLAYELLMWLIRTMKQITPEEVAERVVYRDVPVEVPVEVEVPVLPADRFDAARLAYEASIEGGRRGIGRRLLADRWGLEIREAVEIIEKVTEEHAPAPKTEHPEVVVDELVRATASTPSLNGSGPAHATVNGSTPSTSS